MIALWLRPALLSWRFFCFPSVDVTAVQDNAELHASSSTVWGKGIILASLGSGPPQRTEALCLHIFSSTEYQPSHPIFFLCLCYLIGTKHKKLFAVKIASGKLIWDNHHSEPEPACTQFIHFASVDSNNYLPSDAASPQVLKPMHTLFSFIILIKNSSLCVFGSDVKAKCLPG